MITNNTQVFLADGNKAKVLQVVGDFVEVEYQQGGFGWWPISSCVELEPPQWGQFAQLLSAAPAMRTLYLGMHPIDAALLTAATLRAADGDFELFIQSWRGLVQQGAVTHQLGEQVFLLAEQCKLPRALINNLKPRRARNPDGTFIADDPSTPDIDEAWEL